MKTTAYHTAICDEMLRIEKIKKSIFLGQQVASENFYNTLNKVSMKKRIEMPVAEEMQMGMSMGLAMEGFLPISIYQRMDFLPRAADQLLNHLNLMPELSRNMYNPKVIIRTTVGNKKPIDAGLQHTQDFTDMFKKVLKFPVIKVTTPKEVHKAYKLATNGDSPIMIVEMQSLYYKN